MAIREQDIPHIRSVPDLAPLLSVSSETLTSFLDSKEEFIARGILHSSHGARPITYPCDDPFRHCLKECSLFLSAYYKERAPDCVHGFLEGKSTVTNAAQHTRRRLVLNVDIKNFFPSIGIERIQAVFRDSGFCEEVAQVLAELVTVDGVLATGFSTSPALSNIVCLPLDNALEELADEYGATYTRYADDMTFSSDGNVPETSRIETVLRTYGFSLNPRKTRLYRKGGPQYVTGLTVVDERPRLPKRRKRQLRLEAYHIGKRGFMEHFLFVSRRSLRRGVGLSRFTRHMYSGYGLEGFFGYINAVEPSFARAIMRSLQRAPK